MKQYIRIFLPFFLITFSALSLAGQSSTKADDFFYRAVSARTQGNYDEALALLEHAWRIDSTDAAIKDQMSNVYAAMGYSSEALSFAQGAYETNSTNRYYASNLARLYMSRQEYAAAAEIVNELCEKYPEEDNLSYLLASLYAASGEEGKAHAVYRELESKAESSSEAANVARAEILMYQQMGQEEKALEVSKRLTELYPNEIPFLLQHIGSLLTAEQNDKAKAEIDRLKEIDTEQDMYHFAYASYLLQIGETDKVPRELQYIVDNDKIEVDQKLPLVARFIMSDMDESGKPAVHYNYLVERLLEAHPEDINLRVFFSELLSEQGDKEKAVAIVTPATELYPKSIAPWLLLLQIALENNDEKTVIQVSRAAREHIPQLSSFYIYDAILTFQAGNIDESEQTLLEAIERIDPAADAGGTSSIYVMLGDIAQEKDKIKESWNYYEKALEANPNEVSALNNYAYSLAVEGGDLDKALRLAGRAVERDNNTPSLLDTYGYIYYLRGEYTMARIYLEKAVRNSEEIGLVSASILENLADVYLATEEYEKARHYYKEALKAGATKDEIEKKLSKLPKQ